MVARRVPSTQRRKQKRRVGRPVGAESELKRVAKARAAKSGMLPDELLLDWARTGRMYYPGTRKTKRLEPNERIACAKGCAGFYRAPYAARTAPGEQPPVVRLEIDEKMITALATKAPDKLDVLRDVLRAIAAGGADISQALTASDKGRPDPARYGKMLTESSDVAGRA